MLDALISLPQGFALIAFRLLGIMAFAPMLGSDRIPRTVKLYLALVFALAVAASLDRVPVVTPSDPWRLALGIGGELAFGLFVGTILSTAFVAARWAGGVAGQQMGFNIAGAFNPRADLGGSPLGDAYYVLAMLLFIRMDGHLAMVRGLRESFESVPPMAFAFDGDALVVLTNALAAGTALAARLAAPICVAMLVVDLSLGMLGKTIPSLNLLSVGLSVRALAGTAVVILGLFLSGELLAGAMNESIDLARLLWNGG